MTKKARRRKELTQRGTTLADEVRRLLYLVVAERRPMPHQALLALVPESQQRKIIHRASFPFARHWVHWLWWWL